MKSNFSNIYGIVSNCSEWSRDAVIDAVSLSKAILDFEFIIALYTVE